MKNLILDGNNIAFRAFHIPSKPNVVYDTDLSPVIQFFNMTLSYVKKFQPDHIYIAWDKRLNPEGSNFRKELVEYKDNRPDRGDIQDIYKCIDVIIEVSNSLGIKTIFPWNLEADDVISFLSTTLDGENIIVSSDRDLFQLVTENTKCYNTVKNTIIDINNFKSVMGISLDHYVLYKAILGDKSDNVKGLSRFGEVKSKRLAESFEGCDLDEDQLNIINRNIKIMNLSIGYKHSEGEEDSYKNQLNKIETKPNPFDSEKFKELCETYKLSPLITKLEDWRGVTERKNVLEEWFGSK